MKVDSEISSYESGAFKVCVEQNLGRTYCINVMLLESTLKEERGRKKQERTDLTAT